MRLLKITLAALALLLPFTASAAIATPWNATSTDKGYIAPNKINGNDPWLVISGTGTSTFAGPVKSTCFSNDGSTCITSNSGTVTQINTTWPILGGPITTTGTLTFGGLGTSTAAIVGNIPYFSGVNTFANVATSTLTATSPLTGSFTHVGSSGSLGCQTASGSQAGCLSSTDWTTFNNKQGGGFQISTTSSIGISKVAYFSGTTPTQLSGVATSSSGTANTLTSYDANGNVFFNNYLGAGTLTTGSGGTTVLTAASTKFQALSTAAQTYQLPDATTLSLGPWFTFNNNSSGSLTITNAGGSTQYTTPAGGITQCGPTNIGSANGSWDCHSYIPSNATWGTGTSGIIVNSSLSSTAQILTGASSATVPDFIPYRSAGTTGLGGDGSSLFLTTAGTAKLTVLTGGNVGIGTTTPGSLLSVGGSGTGWNFYDNATSSKSGVGGINIAGGCYAIGGTCLSTGGSGTVTSITAGTGLTGGTITTSGTIALSAPVSIANGGTATTTGGFTNGVEYYDGSTLTNKTGLVFTGTNLGVASSTPTYPFSVGAASAAFGINTNGGIVLHEDRAATSTAYALNWSTTGPQVLYQTGTSATTIYLTAATTSAYVGSRKLVVVCNPGASAGAITWVGVEWAAATVPTQTTTANACDAYSFFVTAATSTSASPSYKVFGAASTNFQ